MKDKQTFKVVLEKDNKSEATGIYIPFDVDKVFGAKRVPVKVWVNGIEYRSTVARMHGKFIMAVPKKFRDAAGIKAGDLIEVAMEKDTEKRTVEVPKDLKEALKKAKLEDVFERMSYTHQKEYVNSINEAKKEETRKRRIEKTIEMVSAKLK